MLDGSQKYYCQNNISGYMGDLFISNGPFLAPTFDNADPLFTLQI